ncbi:BOLA class I histocompatibility antigen, alpha chain BL3-7-like isoform X2 [Silurus meridionalis]|uniref:BOLA class I histocompatibility antigen, alpha chain BL3-7-like isoform X2 n=1 Tax=Silurus meridionalis TaxID=175797 RepID=UPI001EEADE78|nr:BOLA class I histocompatibility antigen, alpha chain BL3-7-like isoform X2 [Silurus meridionalis]
MDLRPAVMKVLLFLIILLPMALAVTHTLQYHYTLVTQGIHFQEFTAVALVDAERVAYYDSNIGKIIPKTEWIQEIGSDFPDYWDNQSKRMQSDQENLKQLLNTIIKTFNHTEGSHTLQRMYGCEVHNGGKTAGYDRYGFDGEDFISLDLENKTWTAANDKAVITKHQWKTAGTEAQIRERYLKNECVNWLMKFVSYSKVTLQRGVACYNVGPWLGVVIGLSLFVILIICVSVFAIWRRIQKVQISHLFQPRAVPMPPLKQTCWTFSVQLFKRKKVCVRRERERERERERWTEKLCSHSDMTKMGLVLIGLD